MNDYLKDRNGGKLPTDALFAYCVRELLQKQWSILLDEDFVKAVNDGRVFMCPDGKERCFYPRIFTYSADYPEKYVGSELFQPSALFTQPTGFG